MIVAGLAYGTKTLTSRQPLEHHGKVEDEDTQIKGSLGSDVRYFAVLGGALSPDLSILPIFLLAVPVGMGLAVETAMTFAVASLLSLLLLVSVGSMGLSKVFERVPAKYNNALVGFVIAAVGAYVLFLG